MSMNHQESDPGGGQAEESSSEPQVQQQTNESYTSATTLPLMLPGGQAATLAELRGEDHDRNLHLAMLLRSNPSNAAATLAAASASLSTLSSNNNEMTMYQLLSQQANSSTTSIHPMMSSSGAGTAGGGASASLSMSQQGAAGGVLPLLYQQQQQQQRPQEVTAALYQQQLLHTPLQQQLLALQRGGFPSTQQNVESSLFLANRSHQQNLALQQLDPHPIETALLQQRQGAWPADLRTTTSLGRDNDQQHQQLLQQAEWLNRQQVTEAYILRALQQEQQQHQQQQDSVRQQQSAEAFRSQELSALLADRALLGHHHHHLIGRDVDGSLQLQPGTAYAALSSTAELDYDDDRKPAAGPSTVTAAALPKEDDSQPPIEQAKKKKKRTSSPPRNQHRQQGRGETDAEFEAFLKTLPDLSRLRRDYDHEAFPVKLHRMLLEVERKSLAHIVSWTDSGKAFRVYIPTLFEKEIGPEYFRHQQYASFRRQLSTYGFQRLRKGPDEGAFGHSLFRRNRPDLLPMIHRVTELSEEQKSILWPDGSGPAARKRKGKHN